MDKQKDFSKFASTGVAESMSYWYEIMLKKKATGKSIEEIVKTIKIKGNLPSKK